MSSKPEINGVFTPDTSFQEYLQKWKMVSYFKNIFLFCDNLILRPWGLVASISSSGSSHLVSLILENILLTL